MDDTDTTVKLSSETEDVLIVTKEEDTTAIYIIQYDQEEGDIGNVEEYTALAEGEAAKEREHNVYETSGSPGQQMSATHARAVFKCSLCSYSFNKRYRLLRHLKSHSMERPHICQVCERGFKNATTLMNHVNTHKGLKPFVCKHCSNVFTSSGELVRHIRYKHTQEKPHKCSECEYASVERSKLLRHMRCHTGERPYQCEHCTYAAADMFKLNRHLRTHTGEKPYCCDNCGRCFTQANSLKTHLNIHNVANKPVFACELCPATCGRICDLRKHIEKLHSSDQLYKCRRCGLNFPDKYSCNMHKKIHAGEKSYRCTTCPYVCPSMRQLTLHMRTHGDEKPFVCDYCQLCFRQKQLLRRHINVSHNPTYKSPQPKEKPLSCPQCRKNYARKGHLIRHMATHETLTELNAQERIQNSDENNEVIDQDPVEAESASNAIPRGQILTVTDGQQCVVLQVIETEDDEGSTTL